MSASKTDSSNSVVTEQPFRERGGHVVQGCNQLCVFRAVHFHEYFARIAVHSKERSREGRSNDVGLRRIVSQVGAALRATPLCGADYVSGTILISDSSFGRY
jgi:hypothetical protein